MLRTSIKAFENGLTAEHSGTHTTDSTVAEVTAKSQSTSQALGTLEGLFSVLFF